MDCKIKNDIGTIYITEDVLLKVVGYAALECYGIVAMSSKRAKDGIVEWLGRENLSKGVQIRSVGDMLDVVHHRGIRHLHCRGVQDHCRYRALQAGKHDRRKGSQGQHLRGRYPRVMQESHTAAVPRS